MTTSRLVHRLALAGVVLSLAAAAAGVGCASFASEPGADVDGGSPAEPESGTETGVAADGGAFGAPALLYDDDGGAMTLALDQDAIYWAGSPPAVDGGDRWKIRRRLKTGGSVAYVPSMLSSGPIVIDIAPSTMRVVWSEGSGGCTNDAVAGFSNTTQTSEFLSIPCAGRLFQTGLTIYASSPKGDAGTLRVFGKSTPLASGGAVVAQGSWTGPLVSDDASIFAATPTGVVAIALTGGATRSMLDAPGVVDLALDGPELFVATATTLQAMTLATGSTRELATSQHPLRIAVDARFLYWTDGTGAQIMRVSRAGGSVESLAATQGEPTGIAVDQRAVYWSTASGKIFELARR